MKIFRKFTTKNDYESRDRDLYLKYSLEQECKWLYSRSERIKAILSSNLVKNMDVAQIRRLKMARVETNSCVRQFHILEQKLDNKIDFKFLITRGATLIALFLITYLILVAAVHDWVLASGSLFLTFLYIYVYKFIEREYIRPSFYNLVHPKIFPWLMYAIRWIFFIFFLILEAIVLVEWGWVNAQSGEALLASFLISFLAAAYLGLADIHKLLPLKTTWPKNKHMRDAIYAIYLYSTTLVFIFVIAYALILGDMLSQYEFAQSFAVGAVVASTFAAAGNFCFVKIKSRLVQRQFKSDLLQD